MNRNIRLLACAAWVSLGCMAPVPLWAQEVVQALPHPARAQLAGAMQRLSRDPGSLSALIDAGRASVELDDLDAAAGFFGRAERLAPNNAQVLAGQALLALRRADAPKAIELFDKANLAGEPMGPYAAERGLAYDLVGNNLRAQRLYQLALSQQDSSEISRQLALSYAISGDARASEEILLPLLQRQDRAAFRTRAFALAILGRSDEAVTISDTMLPPRLAQRMASYLRFMPRLTRAQQAAAANFGHFPATDQIGRDDPRLAALGIAEPVRQSRTSVDQRLVPTAQTLGQPPQRVAQQAVSEPQIQPQPQPQPQPEPQVVIEPVPVAEPQPEPLPGPEIPAGPAQGQELPALAQQASSRPEPVSPVTSPAPVSAPVSQPEQEAIPVPLPPAPAPPPEPNLAEAFAEFAEAQNVPVAPVADAVDITAIAIPREEPAPRAPAPPVHPARHWVQLATGQDIAAFRFDLRRLRGRADGLLDGRDAFYASWGQTNRLLTGPFDSARAAQQFVSELNAQGISTFRFSSEAGQEVAPLP